LGVVNAVDGTVYSADVVAASQNWSRPVLILLNLRLGIEGINPIYHPSLRTIFTFPQSVGIAGGRPSSSYYFVGYQDDSLFYIDPHHTKESVSWLEPPEHLQRAALTCELTVTPEDWQMAEVESMAHANAQKASSSLEDFYTTAYSPLSLSSFHPEKVRKIALSGLDPSMLVGFVVEDANDFQNWNARSAACKPAVYAIAEKMPTWARSSSSASRRISGSDNLPPSPGTFNSSQELVGEESEPDEADWDITDSEEESSRKGSERVDKEDET